MRTKVENVSMKNNQTRFAILVSGRGSNMSRLIDSSKQDSDSYGSIQCVISDNKKAPALKIAKNQGIKSKYISPGKKYRTRFTDKAQAKYIKYLKKNKVDYILLAGFMRMLKPGLIDSFPNRIINIHPSLLPAYSGLDTHSRVIDAGEKTTGCSVHFVDSGMDTGKLIAQSIVEVSNDDTPASLGKKVLEKEHKIYPYIMKLLADNKIEYENWKMIVV